MRVSSQPNPISVAGISAAIAAAMLLAFGAAIGSVTIVIGLLSLAIAIIIVCDWTLGVPVLLVVASTDGFIKHFSDTAASYVLKDATLALIMMGLALRLGLSATERPRGVRWSATLVWAVYIGFLTTQLLHPASSFEGALGAYRAHGMFALLFVVGTVYFRHRERLTGTANLVIVLCGFCALSAIVQHFMGERWMQLSPGFMKASLHYTSFASLQAKAVLTGAIYRMYGSLVDPASLGLACAYGTLFAVASLARLRGIWRIFAIAAIPLMTSALALSQARADMAGLGVGLLVLAALSLREQATRLVAIGGLILIVLAVPVGVVLTGGSVVDRVLSQDNVAYSEATRDRSRSVVLAELPQFPFGHGLGATGAGGNLRQDPGFIVDNLYVATLYETGIIGLGLLVAFQLTFLVLGLQAVMRAKDLGSRTVFIGVVAGQIAQLVAGWFSQGPFDYAPVSQFFWLFSGAVARRD